MPDNTLSIKVAELEREIEKAREAQTELESCRQSSQPVFISIHTGKNYEDPIYQFVPSNEFLQKLFLELLSIATDAQNKLHRIQRVLNSFGEVPSGKETPQEILAEIKRRDLKL